MARIVEPAPARIVEAAAMLRAGDCVAIPTETVYGLAADTFNPRAVEGVYQLKGRPADNPLIAHVLDAEQATQIVRGWDDRCELLAKMFWPGPLTLVLRKTDSVPAQATAGLGTIAVRAPNHDVARALLREFGGPISAPSANRSGHVSPTTATHVLEEFADAGDLMILDGGPCLVGIESTVLDMTAKPVRMLRPGMVTAEQLRPLIGAVDSGFIGSQAAGPGTSLRHYAPRTPVDLVSGANLRSELAQSDDRFVVLCFDASAVDPPHRAIQMPREAAAYAAKLYEALRDADAMKCDRIVIELPPLTSDIWHAVHDRLRRAAAR
jgi:L-threonylcarbamoyladenylate synthase